MSSSKFQSSSREIAILGGGAAGVFCAILLAQNSNHRVRILEQSRELLKKVAISGGGRCNVTHQYISDAQFSKNYPRGQQWMKKNLAIFGPKEMKLWLESHGVQLKTEPDGRIFPVTDQAQTMIDLFMKLLKKYNVQIHYSSPVISVSSEDNRWCVATSTHTYNADRVIIATGGSQKLRDLDFLRNLRLNIIATVPSLFTFKIKDTELTSLMGTSVKEVEVRIVGSSYVQRGGLLVTHWGLSGPAILKLSAWAAVYLSDQNYQFQIAIRWIPGSNEDEIRQHLLQYAQEHKAALLANTRIDGISQRLWSYLLAKADIAETKKWHECSKKDLNKLCSILSHTVYQVSGKSTNKDEFVTAGGIDLDSIDPTTMEIKMQKGLYAIGEVINIDGVTGGFNFQNAWTGAYICAQAIHSA